MIFDFVYLGLSLPYQCAQLEAHFRRVAVCLDRPSGIAVPLTGGEWQSDWQ